MTPTAELRGAHPNRERRKNSDLVTQIYEVQSRKRCSQIRALGHYLANEVILSRGPLLPHIPESVVERRILLLSDRHVRFFSVSDTRISTDRSLSCIESVETKKRAANACPIMFDSDTNKDWGISSSGDKNSKTCNISTTTKAIPPVLTSTKSKWETRKARPGRRRPLVFFFVAMGSTSLHLHPTSYLWPKRYGSVIHHLDIQIWQEISVSFVTIPEFYSAQLWSWIMYIALKKLISYCFDHRRDIYIYIYLFIYLFEYYRVSIYIDTLN